MVMSFCCQMLVRSLFYISLNNSTQKQYLKCKSTRGNQASAALFKTALLFRGVIYSLYFLTSYLKNLNGGKAGKALSQNATQPASDTASSYGPKTDTCS